MNEDDLMIGVQVSSGAPGVTPAAFVAVVEVLDAEGEKRYEVVESNGLTGARRSRIIAALAPEPCPECGAHEGEWCDSGCAAHASGSCGLPHGSCGP